MRTGRKCVRNRAVGGIGGASGGRGILGRPFGERGFAKVPARGEGLAGGQAKGGAALGAGQADRAHFVLRLRELKIAAIVTMRAADVVLAMFSASGKDHPLGCS